jgi:hypothetical protein
LKRAELATFTVPLRSMMPLMMLSSEI